MRYLMFGMQSRPVKMNAPRSEPSVKSRTVRKHLNGLIVWKYGPAVWLRFAELGETRRSRRAHRRRMWGLAVATGMWES
jgi:hypothetical protein